MDCKVGMESIPEKTIDICLTDPPYNLGKNYGSFNDSKEEVDYWEWIDERFTEVFRILKEPGFLYVSHSDKGIFTFKPLLEKIGFNFVQLLYWVAKNGYGQHNITRWSYRVEPILFMVKSLDYELKSGPGCRWYTSYFEVPRPQSNFKEGRQHPTQKPVKFYVNILDRTLGKLVIDPFLGSGTALIASRKVGKIGLGFEISEKYAQEQLKRREKIIALITANYNSCIKVVRVLDALIKKIAPKG